MAMLSKPAIDDPKTKVKTQPKKRPPLAPALQRAVAKQRQRKQRRVTDLFPVVQRPVDESSSLASSSFSPSASSSSSPPPTARVVWRGEFSALRDSPEQLRERFAPYVTAAAAWAAPPSGYMRERQDMTLQHRPDWEELWQRHHGRCTLEQVEPFLWNVAQVRRPSRRSFAPVVVPLARRVSNHNDNDDDGGTATFPRTLVPEIRRAVAFLSGYSAWSAADSDRVRRALEQQDHRTTEEDRNRS